MPVHPAEAGRQPALQVINLALVAPKTWLVRPAPEVPRLGLVQGLGHLVNDGVYIGRGKSSVSQLKVAVNVLLDLVFVDENGRLAINSGTAIGEAAPRALALVGGRAWTALALALAVTISVSRYRNHVNFRS